MKHNNQTGDLESPEEAEFVSKTQLKNEAKALVDFAKLLIELPEAKLLLLPLNDNTKIAVRDYHKHNSNIARRRHMAYIGKCLRNDNAQEAQALVQEDAFSQLREQKALSVKEEPTVGKEPQPTLVDQLLDEGDAKINALIEQQPQLDRQRLRQLVRNLKNAKTTPKQSQTRSKLVEFLACFQLK